MKAVGSYTVAKWQEEAYDQISPTMKLTKGSVEYVFTGEVSGKAFVEYLMYYSNADPNDPHKSSAEYIGLIRFHGSLGDRPGSFVLYDRGTFGDGAANSILEIAAGSGTGALQGITGGGTYRADRESYRIELDYTLP